jgi:hypothetical protein
MAKIEKFHMFYKFTNYRKFFFLQSQFTPEFFLGGNSFCSYVVKMLVNIGT